MDGNGLLKTYALSMEDKMAAGAFGRTRSYGPDGHSTRLCIIVGKLALVKEVKEDSKSSVMVIPKAKTNKQTMQTRKK